MRLEEKLCSIMLQLVRAFKHIELLCRTKLAILFGPIAATRSSDCAPIASSL